MNADLSKLKVTYFHRKPRKGGNYSLEAIFEDVRSRLANAVEATVSVCPYESDGVLPRLSNVFAAMLRQGHINHVTGDISYIGIGLARTRTIQTILDLGPLSRTAGMKRWLLEWIWFRIPVMRAAHVTVISEATRDALLRTVRCNPSKVSVIPVAIHGAFRHFEKAFSAECPRILQVGTSPNKNLPRLVAALAGVNCQLDIVGGPVQGLEDLLQAQGTKYSWRSALSRAEVVEAYKAADIVAFPSTLEGFGMPILEGQAVGRPVVTSNIAPMTDVAGGAACLVDPLSVSSIRNGILRIVEDRRYREELVDAGLRNVKRFDPEQIAAQYLNLYRRMRCEGIERP